MVTEVCQGDRASEVCITLPDPRHVPASMDPLEIISVTGGELRVYGDFADGDECKVIQGTARLTTVNCDCGEGFILRRKWTVL